MIGFSIRIVPGIGQRFPRIRLPFLAVHGVGRRNAGYFQNGWNEIGHILKLPAPFSFGLDGFGVSYGRGGHGSSEMGGHLFGPLERGG